MATLKYRIENGVVVITPLKYNRSVKYYLIAGRFFNFLGLKAGDVLIRRVVNNGWWRLEKLVDVDSLVGPIDFLKVGRYGTKDSGECVIYIKRDMLGENIDLKNAQVLMKVLDSEPGVVYMKVLSE